MAIDNTPMLVPHLVVGDAAAALDFYARAFGAEEMVRLPGPDGKLMHACMRIHGSMVFLNDDFPEYNDGVSSTPAALGGTPVTLHLHGADVVGRIVAWSDEAFGQARTVCIIDPENGASRKVAEKNGYREILRTTYHDKPTILLERQAGGAVSS